MTPLDFIASIVASLAWPLAALVAAYVLRQPLADLIRTLRSVRYQGLELDFERLEQIAAEAKPTSNAERLNESATPRYAPPGTYEEFIERLASLSPHAAISEAWRRVERALDRYFERRGQPRSRSLQAIRQALAANKDLDTSIITLLQELRLLRNRVVHEPAVHLTEGQAIEFGQMSWQIISALEEA